jgi:hypothetical protein
MASTSIKETKTLDTVFISSSLAFNLLLGGVWIAWKLGDMALLRMLGVVFVCLIAPYAYVLFGYLRKGVPRVVTVSLLIVLFYLFLELLLDFILVIPFRDILALHVFYIIAVYAAAFSIIGVSFRIDRKMGFAVLITFWIALACLLYMYLG